MTTLTEIAQGAYALIVILFGYGMPLLTIILDLRRDMMIDEKLKESVDATLKKHRVQISADFKNGDRNARRIVQASHLWNSTKTTSLGRLILDCLYFWNNERKAI